MSKNTAELIQESKGVQLWEVKKQQKEAKIHTQKSILKIIERVNGSKLSEEMKEQIEGFYELEILETILNEIWNVKEMDKIVATINKYDWLDAMKRLEEE
jgi:hypothetical protein